MKTRLLKSMAAVGAVLLIGMNAAWADDYADVAKLLKDGQHAEALKRVDAALRTRPRDAQMRFLKGVILAEQNKTSDAIAIFTKLTEDYPKLPEPYNNLAVLYAADNQYEKARITLDKAIRTNPSYATAYENLGDIHAKLASMAYDKALQLDSDNPGAKSKLTLVRSLVATASVPAAKVIAEPTAQQKPAVAAPPQPAAPAPAQVAKATPPEEKKPTSKPVNSKPAPALANDNADRDAVLATVDQWAKAWSARDVKAYLNFYGSGFDLPKGMSRKAWAAERRARIVDKERISVSIASPHVSIKGNAATVTFRQSYDSDRLTANSRKTLVLAKQGSRWQIVQEQTGG